MTFQRTNLMELKDMLHGLENCENLWKVSFVITLVFGGGHNF